MGILNLRCLLDIQMEKPGRQTTGTSELSAAARAEAIHWESVLMDSLLQVDGQGSGLSHAQTLPVRGGHRIRRMEGGKQQGRSQKRVLRALIETGPFRKGDGGYRPRMPCLVDLGRWENHHGMVLWLWSIEENIEKVLNSLSPSTTVPPLSIPEHTGEETPHNAEKIKGFDWRAIKDSMF